MIRKVGMRSTEATSRATGRAAASSPWADRSGVRSHPPRCWRQVGAEGEPALDGRGLGSGPSRELPAPGCPPGLPPPSQPAGLPPAPLLPLLGLLRRTASSSVSSAAAIPAALPWGPASPPAAAASPSTTTAASASASAAAGACCRCRCRRRRSYRGSSVRSRLATPAAPLTAASDRKAKRQPSSPSGLCEPAGGGGQQAAPPGGHNCTETAARCRAPGSGQLADPASLSRHPPTYPAQPSIARHSFMRSASQAGSQAAMPSASQPGIRPCVWPASQASQPHQAARQAGSQPHSCWWRTAPPACPPGRR